MQLTHKDILQLKSKGLTVKDLDKQIENFKNGFPFLKVFKPAKIGDGILKLTGKEIKLYQNTFEKTKADVLKFIPASGAATRMFSFLHEFYEKADDHYADINQIKNDDVIYFFKNIEKFAFSIDLKLKLYSNGLDIRELLKNGRYKTILHFFLFNNGLNYSELPKGVLQFHVEKDNIKTAIEEHLIESAMYAKSHGKTIKIHFTVSPEHISLFKNLIQKVKPIYEKQYKVKYKIGYSRQKSSTDMVAVDMNNELFRNDDGSLLFRPGGHGALIENLNDLDSDIIFIKNIDNVVPDRLKDETILYKKVLAGILMSYKEKIHDYIQILSSKELFDSELKEIGSFIKNELCFIPGDEIDELSNELQAHYFIKILNRPIRVCGMVKNEGEPGGGPFWVEHSDGSVDLQIVETSQIDPKNPNQLDILKKSTHFNPVDLVLYTKNYKNEKFNLLQYRDPETGFITHKTKDGRSLKAQELPGLWNGAMAYWNTIFVEVPISTFNPVKTINDLLRPEHQ
ncbi:MAG: NAD metabolism ATPase/kinase [Bacteroidetes bacterium GWC2_33_15]|nr:MAG: NAD metabolism ATPase/kinase [Bacteroidetes bacterium GWA2_33_15]OFX52223.1 MAG: NAD metabolism ATPase/kinase [Bacteroidetes bacterium GWC2_33_15]OFX64377.1 MAG: NAD metabolism ATPase/kinase [Bacteroidetes bacterium GWB2_32_14]OFX67782.1 MAG: NAD metabolism ATPase/kinase [Bacteroidetes bacterium GWD2_33_33]HAN19394.1 DUF4301 domain-containing protein [Bacteroidales bacterium]